MAYDAGRSRIVLFGGRADTIYFGDTWEYDGSDWTEVFPTNAPPNRRGHALVYDEVRGTVLLFGGTSPARTYDDTWEWDGRDWTELDPTTTPSARSDHEMVYDSARSRVVMFAGTSGTSETWEWDGVNWANVSPSSTPSAGSNPALVHDRTKGVSMCLTASGATWEWDGSTWTQFPVTGSAPAPRGNHAMQFDQGAELTVMFGGERNGTFFADTWEWDGSSWTEVSLPASPPPRAWHSMAYDSARKSVVVFGGRQGSHQTVMNDTWEYRSVQIASYAKLGSGCGGVGDRPPTLSAAASSRPILGSTFYVAMDALPPQQLAVLYIGASNTSWAGASLPINLAPTGHPGCEILVSPDIPAATIASFGTAVWALPVPANAALLGKSLFLQGFATTPGLATSDAGNAVIGGR